MLTCRVYIFLICTKVLHALAVVLEPGMIIIFILRGLEIYPRPYSKEGVDIGCDPSRRIRGHLENLGYQA